MRQFADLRLLNGAVIVLTLCLFAACLAYRQKSKEADRLRERLAFQIKAHEETVQNLAAWEAKYPERAEEFRKAQP